MREIGGAVERIDMPAIAGSVAGFVAGAFFGGDGVIGKKFGDARDDGGFGALVGLGDQVDFIAFVGDLRGTRRLFAKDLAGFARNFDGSLEIIFWHQPFMRLTLKPNSFLVCAENYCGPVR